MNAAALPCIHQVVRQFVGLGNIRQASPHQALGGGNGVAGVARLRCHSRIPDLAAATLQIADDRRQEHPAVGIGDVAGVQQRAVQRGIEDRPEARVGVDFDAVGAVGLIAAFWA